MTGGPASRDGRRLRLDPLGALLSAAGAAALMLLPFVLIKANRIVPGDPRALGEVLPAWGALACEAALLLSALVALGVADARVRLAAALLGVVAVALAVAAAGDALTPPGNKVVRIAPGAAFWVLLVALGLMATDATTRLRPGPGLRVLFLAMSFGIAALVLAHGTFDNLSVMREYAVNATRFAHEARRHVWLALGSLGAAVIVALPLGILCHRMPRLRPGVLGALNVIQTIPAIALFGILMAPLGALATALPWAGELGIRGIGAAPAAVALFLYSLLPIVANTVAGLKRVSRAAVEAARGMGMTPLAGAQRRRADSRAAGHPHRYPRGAGAEHRHGDDRGADRRRRARDVRVPGHRPDGDRSGAARGDTDRGTGVLRGGAARCAGGGHGSGEDMITIESLTKCLRHDHGRRRVSRWRFVATRSRRSSAPPARASRRCCA